MVAKNNVIDVGFKKRVQKVRLGGIDFEIKEGGKHRKKYMAVLPELEDKMKEFEKEHKKAIDDKDYKKAEEIELKMVEAVKEVVELILGEGSFDQLYEAAEEDVEVIVFGLEEVMKEYFKIQEKKRAQRVIDAKKRNK